LYLKIGQITNRITQFTKKECLTHNLGIFSSKIWSNPGKISMTTVGEPRMDERSAQTYMGIRTQTPMKILSKTVTGLFKESNTWARAQGLKPAGPLF
jgi:hypothetical protein